MLTKSGFFIREANKKPYTRFKEKDFDLAHLRLEFHSAYRLFLANSAVLSKNQSFMQYLYTLNEQLLAYYARDYVKKELEAALMRKNRLLSVSPPLSGKSSGHAALLNTPLWRQILTESNTYRTHINYSFTFANNVLIYLNIDGILRYIAWIEQLRFMLRTMGIALFGLRFSLELALLCKHVILAAQSNELSATKVLVQELEKRGFSLLNDLFWGTVTLLTNFNKIMHFPGQLIAPLFLAGFVFDFLVLTMRWFCVQKHYKECIDALNTRKNTLHDADSLLILTRQLEILNDEWQAEQDYLRINLLAASLFVLTFSLTFLISIPLALLCLTSTSLLGNALYNCADEYKKYRICRIAAEREASNNQHNARVTSFSLFYQQKNITYQHTLEKKADAACAQFYLTLGVNVGTAALIITAAAISWSVALGLFFCYLSYKAYQATSNDIHDELDVYQPRLTSS